MEGVARVTFFGWLDYTVFVAVFLVAIGIGLYFAFAKDGQDSVSKYLMGNRNLGLVPTTLSILVSVVSANTLLGVPAEVYNFGVHILLRSVCSFLSIVLAAFLFVPLFYALKLTSVHEYLELRYKSKLVRIFGTFLLCFTQILYVGCVIFGPAIALETGTGILPWVSILLVAIIGTLYTTMGGMKAVIWTDVFQSGIMIAGMLAVIFLGASRVGGFGKVWEINRNWGRLYIRDDLKEFSEADDRIAKGRSFHSAGADQLKAPYDYVAFFNPDPTERMSFWVVMIGHATHWFGGLGVNQPCVQRYCAMRSLNMAKFSILLAGPGQSIFTAVSSIAGMVVFAYYANQQCDPLRAGYISNSNQLLPYFVMDVLSYPGLPGLFMACLFSGSLSTFSSSTNSLAAVIWEDILKNHFNHLPESRKALITKILVGVFGAICTGVAFLVWAIGGNLIQMAVSLVGASMGPLMGLFLLGAAFPWANWIGALTGASCAMLLNLWILVGQTLYKTQAVRLPSPTEGCFITGPENATAPWTTVDWSTEASMTTTPEPDPLSAGLRWLYSISFGWYPVSAIIITLLVGIPVSLISGPNDPATTESRLFFGCLKKKYGKAHEEDIKENETINHQDFGNTNAGFGMPEEETQPSRVEYSTRL